MNTITEIEDSITDIKLAKAARRLPIAIASVAGLCGVKVKFEHVKQNRSGAKSIYHIDGVKDDIVGMEAVRLKLAELIGKPVSVSALNYAVRSGAKIGRYVVNKVGTAAPEGMKFSGSFTQPVEVL